MRWNVYESQYEVQGRPSTRLPDKIIARGVHQAQADALVRKYPSGRWASPTPPDEKEI